MYSTVDLFSGLGGLSIGFRWAGFEILSGVEFDRNAADSYQIAADTILSRYKKYKGGEPIVIREDIRKLSATDIIDGHSPDVVFGGPPCQGFSNVGRVKINSVKRNLERQRALGMTVQELRGELKSLDLPVSGNKMDLIERLSEHHKKPEQVRFIDDPRNELYKEYLRIIGEFRQKPKVIMIENVPGILSFRNGQVIADIEDDFNNLGYRFYKWVLNAADYGVPQTRKRVFLIGTRNGRSLSPPTPTHVKPSPVSGRRKPWITAEQAFLGLPVTEPGVKMEEFIYPTKDRFNDFNSRMRYGTYCGNIGYNHSARQHNERDLAIFSRLQNGERYRDFPKEERPYKNGFNDTYKLVEKNIPSHTVTAHLCRDGLSHIHPTQLRSITPREAARLQSIPDAVKIAGPRTRQFKQIGNAVPPLLAKAIGHRIYEYLQRIS